MSFFSKRTDGHTSDGTGDSRKGFIDVIKYDGLNDELIWKFPYENISVGAQLIVNQSQEAIFLKGGVVCDIFGPGTHTLDANNIPILQKLINLPFGGRTPFTAEVWFVSKTVKRNLKWGTKTPVKLRDPLWGILIPVRGYGEYGVQITDSSAFLTQIVGTQHITTTEDVIDQFKGLILTKVTDSISKYIVDKKVSVIDIPAQLDEISFLCKSRIQEEFSIYGISITNLYVSSINYPDDDPGVQQINQAIANRMQRNIEGFTYQQERSFDVLQSAAGNEGSAGNVMGAGMGLGMGVGIGNVFGAQFGQLNAVMTPTVAPPPPPTASIAFHILVNNVQQGPFELTHLSQLVQSGQVTRDTLVWRPGMPQWIKAGECSELSMLFVAVSTPPPPPPIV
jgi:membrane protease subunit (stomatin/prohibitin family)